MAGSPGGFEIWVGQGTGNWKDWGLRGLGFLVPNFYLWGRERVTVNFIINVHKLV